MLTLQDSDMLTEPEEWLYNAYKNIVSKIVSVSVDKGSRIDPFASQFMGLKSVMPDHAHYHALLEVTSYFWGSKGGRGSLLEKTVRLLAGDKAVHNKKLSDFLSDNLPADLKGTVSRKFTKKFDLINMVNGKKIVLLEIKNRIDSGGATGRRDALNKFTALCNEIENNTIMFTDHDTNKEYTLPELLAQMGITEFEMLLGLFYNTHGGLATIEHDKKWGWYGESKKLVEDYAKRHFETTNDLDYLRLQFKKSGVQFTIQTVFGDEPTMRFTGNTITLNDVLKRVFPQDWDDIWLALTVGIKQKQILLDKGKNHFTEFDRFRELPEFQKNINTLRIYNNDSMTVDKIVCDVVNMFADSELDTDKETISDCLYVWTAGGMTNA